MVKNQLLSLSDDKTSTCTSRLIAPYRKEPFSPYKVFITILYIYEQFLGYIFDWATLFPPTPSTNTPFKYNMFFMMTYQYAKGFLVLFGAMFKTSFLFSYMFNIKSSCFTQNEAIHVSKWGLKSIMLKYGLTAN